MGLDATMTLKSKCRIKGTVKKLQANELIKKIKRFKPTKPFQGDGLTLQLTEVYDTESVKVKGLTEKSLQNIKVLTKKKDRPFPDGYCG